MPIIEVKVTEGTLTAQQKQAIKQALTKGINDVFADILGAPVRPATWVVVQDRAGAPWATGGGSSLPA